MRREAAPSNDELEAVLLKVIRALCSLLTRLSWARLFKRVFDVDVEHCPNCGGALKIIAAIEDPPVIIKTLSHPGLPTRAPPRAPARRVDLFQII
jgi:hypothetical protein